MDRHPDDVTAADDMELLDAARRGDRLAFGVLYLRHHAAAWRIACVASRFSPDAEVAVIEGFTRVFSALPAESEEFGTGGVTFRPYLLACVRQAALDRARTAEQAEGPPTEARGASGPAGLAPDGEVVLASLEHHVARGALAALPERARTALWLADVEAMTPAEIAGVLGGRSPEMVDLTRQAREEIRAGREAALGRHEVRSDCRFTVASLEEFAAGSLDPAKGVLVRSHLDLCPPCRMRLGEQADAPAALAAAVPAAPLLGGEAQSHWLASAGDVRPAPRLLPPGEAAAPTRRVPDGPRPAGGVPPEADPAGAVAGADVERHHRNGRTRSWRALAGGAPPAARRAGRALWPALPAVLLVVAWLGVLVSFPYLITPETAPGPRGLSLPALRAFLSGDPAARPSIDGAEPAPPGSSGVAADGSQRASASGPATPIRLIPTSAVVPPSGPTVGVAVAGVTTDGPSPSADTASAPPEPRSAMGPRKAVKPQKTMKPPKTKKAQKAQKTQKTQKTKKTQKTMNSRNAVPRTTKHRKAMKPRQGTEPRGELEAGERGRPERSKRGGGRPPAGRRGGIVTA